MFSFRIRKFSLSDDYVEAETARLITNEQNFLTC